MDTLLASLPQAPDYQYHFENLKNTLFTSFFAQMASTMQNPAWHGEGDVWTHTQMVCNALVKLEGFRALPKKQQFILSLAALLHDTGKITCTRLEDGVLVSPNHSAAGASMVRQLLWEGYGLSGTTEKQQFRESVCFLIRYHSLPLHLFQQADPALRARKVAENGRLCPDFTLQMLFLLSEADVRGRIASDTASQLEDLSLNREIALEAGCFTGPYPFPDAHTAHAYLTGSKVWPEQSLYDDTFGEVILLCGLPGTGKDTWLKKHHAFLPMISLDDIRLEMGVSPTDNQGAVVQEAQERARMLLRAKQPFIWNATSLTPQLRRKQVQLFENYGAHVRIVFLETAWQENLRRNAGRLSKVPESVIGKMLGRFIPPECHEARHVEWHCI